MRCRVFLGPVLLGAIAFPIAVPAQQTEMLMLKTVPVPDYKGQTLAQVQAANSKTRARLFESVTSTGPADGVVVSQDPPARSAVIPGRSRLVLTLGARPPNPWAGILQQILQQQAAQQIQVPDLTGETRSEATAALRRVRLRGVFPPDGNGIVTQQNPAPGTNVAPGSPVSVTLSVPRAVVPSLSGMTRTLAETTLLDHQLRLGTAYGNSEGTVTLQSIQAGSEVERGTSVDLTLAVPAPPPKIKVPPPTVKVAPPALPPATNPATGDTGAQPPASQPPDNTVQPPPGPTQDAQPVTAPPAPEPQPQVVTVPNLIGKSLGSAQMVLQTVGLLQGTVDGVENGVVVRQSPDVGDYVPPGSSVNLTLAAVVLPPQPWWKQVSPTALRLGATGTLALLLLAPTALFLKVRKGRLGTHLATPEVRLGAKSSQLRVDGAQHIVRITMRIRDGNHAEQIRTGTEPEIRRRR